MTCYFPLKGWRSKTVNKNGKRPIVFKRNEGFEDMPVTVPCGQCVGCRLDRSRQWAIRCVHEAQMHMDNCFITLTYSDKYVPDDFTLVKKHFQDFMKRLRKKIQPLKISFYMCGEYGDENSRPHYHACIFGYDFPDKSLLKERNGIKLYVSETLENLWRYGYSTIGDVTFDSAAYVARYIMKKRLGKDAKSAYERVNPLTGECYNIIPEYTSMSLKPAIGLRWYEKFKHDVYPSDSVIVQGREVKPPKYYDRLYDIEAPDELMILKYRRKRELEKVNQDDLTSKRLEVRAKCKRLQAERLVRPL